MAAVPAKKKVLNKSDIAALAERWARLQKQIADVMRERDQDEELNALVARHEEELAPIVEKYAGELVKLEERADGMQSIILNWLSKQKKTIVVEAKSAIAKLLKGTRPGNRKPDPEKFIARAEELGKDPWPAVNVVIRTGEPILGKNDFDAICTKEDVEYAEASLELK